MAVNVKGGALEFDAVINDSQFGAVIRKMEMQLQGLTQTANKEAAAVDNLVKRTAQAIGAYASFAAGSQLIRSLVQVRGEFQQLEVSFRTMLQSKEKADQLLAQATELAAKTPFTLQDVGSGAKQLLAYGFGANEVIETLRRLGDVASGVSAPLNDIVYLYGTTRTQGRLYAQDLMQFTSRGIPIIAELAKQFGVAEGEVKKLVEQGKVGFPEVQKVIMSLTSQGGLFFNLMEEQSKTLTGQISNLQDAWARMFNDIGKENEGVFSGAISLATDLVANYETVLDILKVLAITYGTYKAAVIATSAATAIATTVSKGYTIAETLRYQAMLMSERAMKILNLTMLSNPYVAVTVGITALVSALIIFGKRTSEAEEAQKRLNNVQDDAQKSILKEKNSLEQLVRVARDDARSREEKLAAIKKLNQIAPETLGNLTLENIKTQEGIDVINKYIQALERRAKARAAENAISQIGQEKFDVDRTFRDDQERRLRGVRAQDRESFIRNDPFLTELKEQRDKDIARLEEQSKLIQATYADELRDHLLNEDKKQGAIRRTIQVIEDEIAALKKEQKERSANSKEREAYDQKIFAKQKELEAITGKAAAKAEEKAETEAEKCQKKLKELQEAVADAERKAMRSGLAKEESAIDKINNDYDELRKKADEIKAEVLKNDPNLIGQIERARGIEVGNERTKDDVADYERYLEKQKEIFERYEEAKKEIGLQAAKKMYEEQTNGFDNYLSLLEAEADKFLFTRNTLGGQLRLQAIGSAYTDAERAKREREAKEQEELLKKALQESENFRIKELKINQKYDEMRLALQSKFTGKELKERLIQLKSAQEEELAELKSQQDRSSVIYKKMNQDIVSFTRKEIKQLVKDMENILDTATDLPPEQEEAVRNYIRMLRELLSKTGGDAKTAENLGQAAAFAGELSSNIQNVADSVRETNAELADTLGNLSEILSIAESGLSAAASALSGDIGGAVSSVFSYYTKVFDFIFAAPKRTAAQTKAIIDQFQANVLAGEQELNALYRERALQQSRINKLKLEGIQAERKELEKQQKAVQEQFAATLAELQKQVAVVGKTGEKYGGVLGIGRKTRAKDITESLAGRSYEDLEKLFMKGQLEGKALELFNLLQKLKQEGADIDAMLLQNAQDLKEMLTGTTADSITDSILEGFKNGKRGARDFADDFEAMMKDALFQSLKFQALEGPLKEFYEQFASNADSDGMLTEEEIRILRERFNSIINDAGKKFEDLQALTNVGLTPGTGGSGNSLSGAIRGLTAEQADLLAGQFGGLRITALDQLRIAQRNLDTLITIQNHTSNLPLMYKLWQRIESNGIKIN